MCKRNTYGHPINTIFGIILSLILLFLAFWDASLQSSANRTELLERQMEEIATLEVNYIGSYLSDIESHPGKSYTGSANRDQLVLNSLEALLNRQNNISPGSCYYKLFYDTEVQENGFITSRSDSGAKQYTYYLPVPESEFVIAVALTETAFENCIQQYQRVNLILALRVLGVFAILVFFIRFDLRRRQKELLAANERLRVSEERFRIAVTHTAYMVFEYDLDSGTIRILNESAQIDCLLCGARQPESKMWNELIHPNDLPAVLTLKEQIKNGRCEISLVVRVRAMSKTAEYRWCQLTLTAIKDSGGHPVQAVGTLTDIDDQLTETLTLRKKAERDSLTGLFNREECERRVERLLAESHGEKGGVFLLMDMDDFKALNDSMGHISGDVALQTLAAVIRQVFRDSDIAGRMGGDEFMVWLKDVTDMELVERKLTELKKALRPETHGNHTLPHLPVSVGAVFAKPGDHFVDLYNMADIALYQAKKEGRNRHMFYQRDEDSACV